MEACGERTTLARCFLGQQALTWASGTPPNWPAANCDEKPGTGEEKVVSIGCHRVSSFVPVCAHGILKHACLLWWYKNTWLVCPDDRSDTLDRPSKSSQHHSWFVWFTLVLCRARRVSCWEPATHAPGVCARVCASTSMWKIFAQQKEPFVHVTICKSLRCVFGEHFLARILLSVTLCQGCRGCGSLLSLSRSLHNGFSAQSKQFSSFPFLCDPYLCTNLFEVGW